MFVCLRRGDSATSGPHDHFASQQEWLDFVFERIATDVHRMRDRLQTRRTASKDSQQRIVVATNLLIQAKMIDADHLQRGNRHIFIDSSFGAAL